MKDAPAWALTLSYWLHMSGTILWIGGLSAVVFLINPAARRVLNTPDYLVFIQKVYSRLQAIGWFSLALLTATGLLQMSSNPNYAGFLAINNRWAVAILAKHFVFGLMILISAYLTWWLTPALQRAQLRQSRGLEEGEGGKLQRRESVLTLVNLGLAVVILALTALARIS